MTELPAPIECHACGTTHERVARITGAPLPRAGSIIVCAACGAICVYAQEPNQILLVTDADVAGERFAHARSVQAIIRRKLGLPERTGGANA